MTDSNRNDGLQNITTGLGTSRDISLQNYHTRNYYSAQSTQDSCYENYPDVQKIIDTLPNYATDQWGLFTIGGNKPDLDLVDKMSHYLEHLPIFSALHETRGADAGFNYAQKIAHKTGNCGAILLTEESGNTTLDKPLGKLNAITGLYLVDRWELKPELNYSSFLRTTEYYQVTGYSASGLLNAQGGSPRQLTTNRIHKSRVLWFRGLELLTRQALLNNSGCDRSVIDAFLQSYENHETAVLNIARMLQNAGLMLYSVDGLFEKLVEGGDTAENDLKKRLQILYEGLSVYRMGAYDKEQEELKFLERGNLSGVGDAADKLEARKISNSGLPKSIMTGETLGGILTANDQGQISAINKAVSSFQKHKLNSNMVRLLELILKTKDFSKKPPDAWSWQWNPVYPPTAQEQEELLLQHCQAIATLNQVDPRLGQAASLSAFGGAKFSTEIVLPKELKDAMEKALTNPDQAGGLDTSQFDPNAEPQGLDDGSGDGTTPPDDGGDNPSDTPPASDGDLSTDEFDPDTKADSAGSALPAAIMTPPMAVRRAFKKGLDLHEKGQTGSGIEPATIKEARDIASGKPVSVGKVDKAVKWFARNSRFARMPKDSPAYAAWCLWGGSSGRTWFNYLDNQIKSRKDSGGSEDIKKPIAKDKSSVLPELKAFIDQFYTDKIDSIKSYKLDGEKLIVNFSDSGKLYSCEITDTGIRFKQIGTAINPSAAIPKVDSGDRFDIGLPRLTKIGGGKGKPHAGAKHCSKGTSCGDTCIEGKDTCQLGFNPAQKEAFGKLKENASAAIGGGNAATTQALSTDDEIKKLKSEIKDLASKWVKSKDKQEKKEIAEKADRIRVKIQWLEESAKAEEANRSEALLKQSKQKAEELRIEAQKARETEKAEAKIKSKDLDKILAKTTFIEDTLPTNDEIKDLESKWLKSKNKDEKRQIAEKAEKLRNRIYAERQRIELSELQPINEWIEANKKTKKIAFNGNDAKPYNYVWHNNTQIYFEDETGRNNAAKYLRLLGGANYPRIKEMSPLIKNVVFLKELNQSDQYWAEKYKMANLTSMASGGNGEITFYNNNEPNPKTTAHEMGHIYAEHRYGDSDLRDGSDYHKARKSKEPATSDYGKVSIAEDFAEAVGEYALNPDRLKENYPQRFAVIDKLFKDKKYAG